MLSAFGFRLPAAGFRVWNAHYELQIFDEEIPLFIVSEFLFRGMKAIRQEDIRYT